MTHQLHNANKNNTQENGVEGAGLWSDFDGGTFAPLSPP